VAYLGAEAERAVSVRHAALSDELLDAVAEGLLAVDRAGQVLFLNRNARIMLRLFEPDYRGRAILPLLSPEASRALAGMFEEVRVLGAAPARQVEWQSAAGPLPLEVSASRLLSTGALADPDLAGAHLVVIRNLAAGARLARLEEIDRLKSEFISTVSHELKSPLSTVREAVGLLSEGAAGKLSPEQDKLADMVKRNVDWLVRLINDLLDMSRLESGRVNLDKSELDLDGLIASVAARFQVEAARKRLELRVRPNCRGTTLLADRDRIEQVLVNLLANAFKFTPKGFVEVASAVAGEFVEVRVTDSGVGIAREDLPLIFDKFEQVGRRPELARKGTGLGLAISRKLVELHGGTIRVESQPEKGSTFTVRLPRDAGQQGREGPANAR